MNVNMGVKATVFYCQSGVPKADMFRWLVAWTRGQRHEAWAEYDGAIIVVKPGMTVEELEEAFESMPEHQP